MQEIELKFQIPEHALEALRAHVEAVALADPGNEQGEQLLQAAYFDTPDRKLARARAALRVRREDDDWVQTLKAAGAHAMSRLEDNQPVPAPLPGAPIRPDLARHEGDARLALVRDLGWQAAQDPSGAHTGLVQLYRTDMRRLRARQAVRGTDGRFLGLVELALDLGEIAAGALRSPVRELEIELLEGHPMAVIEAARGLVREHGLWLDAQTKAHRGDQLAREADSGRPSPALPARLRSRNAPGASAAQIRFKGFNAALEQAGLNQSEVALGTPESGPWVRGWVLGLRRLAMMGGLSPSDLAGLHGLIKALRPAPGRLAPQDQAVALARAVSTTELSLNLLACLLASG